MGHRCPCLNCDHLYTHAKDWKISVHNFYINAVQSNFTLPLSMAASAQWDALDNMLNTLELSTIAYDKWAYIWGNNLFTSKQAYNTLNGTAMATNPFTWLWVNDCKGHHKFFFWLLLHDRLNTRNIMRRKNHHLDSYDCVLCNRHTKETVDHVFFHMPFL